MKTLLAVGLLLTSNLSIACTQFQAGLAHLNQTDFSFDKQVTVLVDGIKRSDLTEHVIYKQQKPSYSNKKILVKGGMDDIGKATEYFREEKLECSNLKVSNNKVINVYHKNINNHDFKFQTEYRYQPASKLLIPVKTVMTTQASKFFMHWEIKQTVKYQNVTTLKSST
ncbi:hypothetical protein D5018_02640 [Parashewanella curva]|uniref:DUF4390 domain-containing protein n=1 Tax=Parashewanella curva TaxID=2338552 RepID=A0A3L8Q3D6_9GAMM|nr:hypothetical protein [Parashewanella curva]RLV61172.1 hypothetical protein D5018_02640 [Parashewanella curva]